MTVDSQLGDQQLISTIIEQRGSVREVTEKLSQQETWMLSGASIYGCRFVGSYCGVVSI